MRTRDYTSLTTAAVILIAAVLPFASLAPNRVAEPQSLSLIAASGAWGPLLNLLSAAALLAAAKIRKQRLYELIPGFLVLSALLALSLSSARLPADGGAARIGAGPGFWIWFVAAYLYGVTAGRSSRSLLIPLGIIVLFLALGGLSHLGPVREFAVKRERFLSEVAAHLSLSIGATLLAASLAIPAGILSYRYKIFSRFAFTGANIIQTLPSLALFGLMIAPLAWLTMRFPVLRSLGVKGVGNFPALIALTGYSALPILRNTYTGLEVIPRGAIMAGRGMGMSPLKLMGMVEIPLALPVILAGFRIAFVQAIGNTTVAALIGAGGLGNFVFQGLGQAAPDLILLGVIPLIALAIAADSGLKLIERLVTPKPFREAA